MSKLKGKTNRLTFKPCTTCKDCLKRILMTDFADQLNGLNFELSFDGAIFIRGAA